MSSCVRFTYRGDSDGAAGDGAEGWHAEVDGPVAAGGDLVHLGEFVPGGGEAGLESLGFAGPAFALGFGDAGGEVGADFGEPGFLGGVGAQERAADAGFSELTV